MKIFKALDDITSKNYKNLEIESEILLEIMPELHTYLRSYLTLSISTYRKQIKCAYIDESSYVLIEEEGGYGKVIYFVYFRNFEHINSEPGLLYAATGKQNYTLNNYRLLVYNNGISNLRQCFTLSLQSFGNLNDFTTNENLLSWLMICLPTG